MFRLARSQRSLIRESGLTPVYHDYWFRLFIMFGSDVSTKSPRQALGLRRTEAQIDSR